MAMPIMLTSRDIRYGACVAIGSANGGSQMRVGNGADLVLHVDDLRLPLPPRVLHHPRLDHVEHVGVAIVVVADVLLVQLAAAAPPRTASRRCFVIPVGDHLMPVRIDRRPQHQHDVVEDARDLRIVGLRQQIVGELHRVLRAGDFGRVQPAVDVHEGLAFPRQRVRLGFTQPRRAAPAAARSRDSDRLREVGRRRDRAPVSRCAPASTCRPRIIVMRSLAASSFWK